LAVKIVRQAKHVALLGAPTSAANLAAGHERAPEALLKLAISLRRLGNNTDACATFAELGRRYPQASKSVLQRADAEKKRANCS